jgi:hypothetical protein
MRGHRFVSAGWICWGGCVKLGVMKKQAADQSFHDRRYQERKRAEAAKKVVQKKLVQKKAAGDDGAEPRAPSTE